MKAQGNAARPGMIVLMGSGETAPSAQKVYHRVFSEVQEQGDEVRVAIVETPAGFEPNSDYVAGQVARFMQKRLQNFRPAATLVPARKRGTAFSPDEPALAALLHDAGVIFMGPGSPTYAVRQLTGSVLWETMRACHRQGAHLILSSAATLAFSRLTLPIYEIYKVGADLHWQAGLDFFGGFGLPLILVSHWNNGDGGDVLDTSRCYLGEGRFDELLAITPGGVDAFTVVGVDENTALAIEPATGSCSVIGVGSVTLLRGAVSRVYGAGELFPVTELGDFCVPGEAEGIDPAIWQTVAAGKQQAQARRAALPTPDVAAQALADQRAQARAAGDWPTSDRLRDALAELGWRVVDTPSGQRLEPR